jgi:alkanesulfonate monooxygenase SsuD/methylene tetrahydromethanopterin reductase-like flavin-dependent oxidoreductase (luciferase family)
VSLAGPRIERAYRKIELVAGLVVLPSRQTMLVAKQAAEVDILSGGRLRLGVSAGLRTSQEHIDAIHRFKTEVGL